MKFPENTYDFKKNRVLLSHLNIELPLVKFDAMLAKYLISTTEDNKISTIARLLMWDIWPLMRKFWQRYKTCST